MHKLHPPPLLYKAFIVWITRRYFLVALTVFYLLDTYHISNLKDIVHTVYGLLIDDYWLKNTLTDLPLSRPFFYVLVLLLLLLTINHEMKVQVSLLEEKKYGQYINDFHWLSSFQSSHSANHIEKALSPQHVYRTSTGYNNAESKACDDVTIQQLN